MPESRSGGQPRSTTIDDRLWLLENAALLRAGRLDESDAENSAEALAAMGGSEGRAVHDHMRVLIAHLRNWGQQPRPPFRVPSDFWAG